MAQETRENIRNLAILSHVDHGKTTLVDALLWQTAILREHPDLPDAVLAAPEAAREKAVSSMPRMVSLDYGPVTINILDTPGRADFGSEVQRTLQMADGILYVVDAHEGPSPRNRFVLEQALMDGLAPIVVLSKMDHPHARPGEVVEEIRGILADLDASERQLDFPVLFCDALHGVCSPSPDLGRGSLRPLLQTILETVPAPKYEAGDSFRMQVAALEYDDFLGRLAIGRVLGGRLEPDQEISRCTPEGEVFRSRLAGLCRARGMGLTEVREAGPGDLVALSGIQAVRIGDTLSGETSPEPLPPLRVDRSTISIVVSRNDSPTAGQDGPHTSPAALRERLWREILTNAAIEVDETGQADSFRIAGRDELQLAILIEMMRREGYEMLVSRPEIVVQAGEGESCEPVETLMLDCAEQYCGVVTQKVEARQGKLTRMVNHGTGRARGEFRIPSRGLIGFRNEYLSDTRGTGIMNHIFEAYEPALGEIPTHRAGIMVADRPGRATAFAIEHLQSRGSIFVSPGDAVYEGMIVGENSTASEIRVDITKVRRKGSLDPDAPAQERAGLIPPRFMSLEQALEFLDEDCVVEVTPRVFRLRKRKLKAGQDTRNS
ncbi:MAG: GTP-binding protein [Acidobacteria bacterium]|uniref:GTP-binding protein n=1 Tax=Candidatus Polarisedimenticola svalbardensis TaxID=2886004 RepID=A0A8J6XS89_9BACT|nr:GTP-binding protein [Candidatus Polarisedimenticola svalbardensis]